MTNPEASFLDFAPQIPFFSNGRKDGVTVTSCNPLSYVKTDQKRENESMIGEEVQKVASRVVGLCTKVPVKSPARLVDRSL